MSNPLRDNALTLLEFSRRNTLGFLEDVPEEAWFHQPFEGANHVAWIVGHLASTDGFFVTTFAGKASQVPESWNELFGRGSKPQPTPARYPPPSELRDVLARRREDLLAYFRGLPDNKLLEPLDSDWERFAPNRIGLAGSIAWHEGLHAGQLTAIRKSLGIGPRFG